MNTRAHTHTHARARGAQHQQPARRTNPVNMQHSFAVAAQRPEKRRYSAESVGKQRYTQKLQLNTTTKHMCCVLSGDNTNGSKSPYSPCDNGLSCASA